MTIQLKATLPDGRTFATKAFDLSQPKAWGMFEQIGPGTPKPAPKILGAKLYSRQVAKEVWEYAIRVSNAACKADGSGFCGEVNFRSIGWTLGPGLAMKPLVRRAFTNETYLAAPTPDGLDQTLQAGASFVRRFLVGTSKALSVYMHPLPTVPRVVSDYGPLRSTLPAVDRRAMQTRYAQRLASLEAALGVGRASPENTVNAKALGWFQGAGDDLSYMYGGTDIQPIFGYEQCPAAIRWHQILADLWIERCLVACYDKDTGEPIPSEAWGNGHQPFDCLPDGDEEKVDDGSGRRKHYPPALDKPAFNAGNNPNRAKIRSYGTPNDAHFSRAIGHAIPSVEFTNDEVHRDYIFDCAHWLRRAHCDVGILGQYAYSLANYLNFARKFPGKGQVISRGFGWTNFVCAAALKYDPTNPAWFKWSDALLEYHRLTSDPDTGITQVTPPRGAFPEAWDQKFIPEDVWGCQIFEQGIVTFGVAANVLNRTLRFSHREASVALLQKACYSTWANPALPVGTYDNPKMFGVSKYVDPRTKPTRGYGPADLTHNENALAVVYRLTGDERLLHATLRLGLPAANLKEKLKRVQESVDREGVYDEWEVELLSALQAAVRQEAKT